MDVQEEVWKQYIVIPQRSDRPVRVEKILEERLRRHRHARELRLLSLQKIKDASAT